MNLNRIVHNLLKHLRNHRLNHGHFLQGSRDTLGIQCPGAFQRQQTRLLNRHTGIGNHIRITAQFSDRPTKRLTTGRPFDHQFQSTLRRTDGTHTVVNTPRPKTALGNLEATAGARNKCSLGQAHVVEGHNTVTVWLIVGAEHRQHSLNFDPRGIQRHQHHGMTAVLVGIGIGQAHEYGNLAIRVANASAPPFATVENNLVAIHGGRGFHVGGV